MTALAQVEMLKIDRIDLNDALYRRSLYVKLHQTTDLRVAVLSLFKGPISWKSRIEIHTLFWNDTKPLIT